MDGVDVAEAVSTARGGLAFDRAYALVDGSGAFVNGKREPRVHEIRTVYDADLRAATFASPRLDDRFRFCFGDETEALGRWFSRHVGRAVAVRHEPDGGFPDDVRAPGPTIVSRATLATVASWFPGLDESAMRLRLRANIEIDGVPPFWEDRMYGEADAEIIVSAGGLELVGTNPCARCVVPSRDALTGEPIATFARVVAEHREATLPVWAARSRFDHFYRLAVNTRPLRAAGGAVVRVGDAIACAASVS